MLLVLLSSSIQAQQIEKYLIATTLGDIEVELYPEKAPVTVQNFRAYVASGAYQNSSFFRVCTPENESDREIQIEVIQGGNVSDSLLLPPIHIETTKETGLKHKDGTLSMARLEPNSAQSSFFICINDQPELDFQGKRNPDGFGFAAFGQVTRGMDIVKKIQLEKDEDQYLIDPIVIHSIQAL
ncbi:peptidylprolyl isomerase [Cyclobacterium qasimii]|uniref:Peptidyl-prolyl cis-trans isomerase n=3 Tax=Cyclobacterium qasimii TaxID=1350429 RepID=S7VCT7_9BACT|nr:peptidylprolyl isomerase [Cyclobacterium qasimii]EPR67387.1 Peptidyl-prolyl cis-trans isomerase PpiA precursor [Cyclobacterium qasimii M12-11B]GEO20427.1 peptidyl-prolyl cis-trans isomerase [Cyclobacterium qasimii]